MDFKEDNNSQGPSQARLGCAGRGKSGQGADSPNGAVMTGVTWKGIDDMLMVKVRELIFDEKLYPRAGGMDQEHVQRMIEAAQRGVEFPPIIAEGKTKRIVDGCHRHEMVERMLGQNGDVAVIFKRYRNDEELFLDALRYNAAHGLTLSDRDRQHSLRIAETLKIGVDRTAAVLRMSVDSAERLSTAVFAPSQPLLVVPTQIPRPQPDYWRRERKEESLNESPSINSPSSEISEQTKIWALNLVIGLFESDGPQNHPRLRSLMDRLIELAYEAGAPASNNGDDAEVRD